MFTPAITASRVSPPAFRTSMARAVARNPFALEMTIFLEVCAGAAASAGSIAEPSMSALLVNPLSSCIFCSAPQPLQTSHYVTGDGRGCTPLYVGGQDR